MNLALVYLDIGIELFSIEHHKCVQVIVFKSQNVLCKTTMLTIIGIELFSIEHHKCAQVILFKSQNVFYKTTMLTIQFNLQKSGTP